VDECKALIAGPVPDWKAFLIHIFGYRAIMHLFK
jgi:hypothetical protein